MGFWLLVSGRVGFFVFRRSPGSPGFSQPIRGWAEIRVDFLVEDSKGRNPGRKPVELGSLSTIIYNVFFLHPRWCRISEASAVW